MPASQPRTSLLRFGLVPSAGSSSSASNALIRPRSIACSMLVTLTGIGDWSSGRAMREPVTTIPSPPLACDPSSPAGDGAGWAKAGAAAALSVAVDAARNKVDFTLIQTSQSLVVILVRTRVL